MPLPRRSAWGQRPFPVGFNRKSQRQRQDVRGCILCTVTALAKQACNGSSAAGWASHAGDASGGLGDVAARQGVMQRAVGQRGIAHGMAEARYPLQFLSLIHVEFVGIEDASWDE